MVFGVQVSAGRSEKGVEPAHLRRVVSIINRPLMVVQVRQNPALESPPGNIHVARESEATAFGDKLSLVRRGELARAKSQRRHSRGNALAGTLRALRTGGERSLMGTCPPIA